jgi:hypothetical protein
MIDSLESFVDQFPSLPDSDLDPSAVRLVHLHVHLLRFIPFQRLNLRFERLDQIPKLIRHRQWIRHHRQNHRR